MADSGTAWLAGVLVTEHRQGVGRHLELVEIHTRRQRGGGGLSLPKLGSS